MQAKSVAAKASETMTTMYSQMKKTISHEVNARLPLMAEAIPDITPVMTMLAEEGQAINSDMATARQEFNRMYSNNEFYLQNMAATYNTITAVVG